MGWIHFFIIIFLFNVHASLGVLYIIGLVIYYVNESSKNKKKQTQNQGASITSPVYRTQPPATNADSGVIDVGGTTSAIPQTNPYGYGNNYGYVPDVVKRLKLSGDDKKFVERLWGRNTNFLAIEQCKNETTKLYLVAINSLREYASSTNCSESTKAYAQKLFTERPPSFFDSNFYSQGTQSFVNDIYKLCENAMRKKYRHNRKLDAEYYLKGLSTQVDRPTIDFIQKKIIEYSPEQPTAETKRSLSLLTPSAWKEEFRLIRQELKKDGYTEEIAKNISELIDTNEYNYQFPELCLEMSKVLSEYNKEESLLCYMLYKGYMLGKGKNVDDLPEVVKRTIFKGDVEKYNEFLSLPLDISLAELRAKIKDIFKIKRKEIVINQKIVEEKRQLDGQVVTEINKILSEDEEIQSGTAAGSLDDIFSTPTNQQEEVQFSELHKAFLQQFIAANYVLPREHIDEFSQKNKTFPSMLINEINEMFYEIYEDSLIVEDGNMYTITEAYRPTIQIT